MRDLRLDIRYALRALRASPASTIAALAALALGIGATTAMLSVVDAVLLRPLPYADADRLVVILHDGRSPVAPANFADWRRETRSFTDLAAAELWTPPLAVGDGAEEVNALRVTSGMLPLLGVRPFLGRWFTPDEEIAGHERVAVISYGLWQRRFASDRSIVGRRVTIDGSPFNIVGVMPPSFQFAPFWATRTELWAPLTLQARSADRRGQSLRVFARLRAGVTLAQARADVASVTSRLEHEYPGTNRDVAVVPLKEKVVGDIRTPLIVLLVGVVFVLLISCANVAHLLLARAAGREREIAVRSALGATRLRLVRQSLVESGVLAFVGGAAGILLAIFGVRALNAAAPAIIPRVTHVTVDARVLLMTLVMTGATAIFFGLIPAVRGTTIDLTSALRDGDRGASDGTGRRRTRALLVVSEFALAMILLAGAGLMIRSVVALRHIDPGFDPRGVMTLNVSTAGTPAADPTRRVRFFAEAAERITNIPGVESASIINHLPIAGDVWGIPFSIEGRPRPRPGESPHAAYRVVLPGYFHTMRIPILRGRDVASSDRKDSPGVVVINEYMATKHWPNESAIGKRISLNDSTWLSVIGIVKNDVRDSWSAPPEEEMFLPLLQEGSASKAAFLVARLDCARVKCDASRLADPMVGAVQSVDRRVPVSRVETMENIVQGATADSRFYLALLVAFAAVAVVLAAVGIYGVMSYTITRRTHEIGIRIALGANPSLVLRSVLREGLGLAIAGACVGVGFGLGLTRLMAGLLYGVAPSDPITFALVAGTLGIVALVATVVPALRATRIDPAIALRKV